LTEWLQLLVSGITLGSIFSLVALGFVTIYRTSKVVNMAQGSFVMLGTMFTYSLLNELGWPFWLSAIVSIVGVILVGVLMFQIVLKPMLKAPPAATPAGSAVWTAAGPCTSCARGWTRCSSGQAPCAVTTRS